ncbi:unnamed protein product [Colias eurytheme]|nr:unnamed protein product [Colias eurytheme]
MWLKGPIAKVELNSNNGAARRSTTSATSVAACVSLIYTFQQLRERDRLNWLALGVATLCCVRATLC